MDTMALLEASLPEWLFVKAWEILNMNEHGASSQDERISFFKWQSFRKFRDFENLDLGRLASAQLLQPRCSSQCMCLAMLPLAVPRLPTWPSSSLAWWCAAMVLTLICLQQLVEVNDSIDLIDSMGTETYGIIDWRSMFDRFWALDRLAFSGQSTTPSSPDRARANEKRMVFLLCFPWLPSFCRWIPSEQTL